MACKATTNAASAWLCVGPSDPLTFGVVTLLLLTVAAMASYMPARRVTRVDPTISLRSE